MSESARTTRMVSGSRSSTSPTTVETSDSWPWPEVEVFIDAGDGAADDRR